MSRRHKKHHEDHDEHPSEAWLIALADMMTLLMVTFLMMFAISIMDLKKFQTFKEAFAEGTGTSLPALPGEGVPVDGPVYEKPVAPEGTTEQEVRSESKSAAKVLDKKALEELQKKLTEQLAKAGLQDQVEARITSRGLVVYVTSAVLFDSGEATVSRRGQALVDGLGVVLGGVGNDLVVEGHTDKRPISTEEFDSNWELSVMRAAAVGRRLIEESRIPGKRVAMSGYGDTRPRKDAATEEAYALNRRVEIVVQLPTQVADAQPAAAPAAPPAPAAAVPAAPTAAE